MTENVQKKPYLGIELTRRCNLRCPHCFTASGGAAHPGIEPERLILLLTELAEAGISTVAFSGGEPLLRADLASLIRHGREVGIRHFGIVTNGFFADRARVQQLAKAGLSTVQVSLDGVDAADHCAVRGAQPRDFYRALRAVRNFLDAGITVDLATIVSRRNLRRAPEMAMFAEALGVRGLRYCTFVPTGRASDPRVAGSYAVDAKDLDQFLELMRTLNRQPDARLQVFIDHGIGPWQCSGEFSCVAGESVAYISAEGDLYPCPGLIFEDFKVGNVLTTPVSTLLASPTMRVTQEIRRNELSGNCRSCSNAACSGGCRGAAYARTGNLRGEVAYCSVRTLTMHTQRLQPTPEG